MYESIELMIAAAGAYPSLAALAVDHEAREKNISPEAVREAMAGRLTVMEESAARGKAGVTSVTGLTGKAAQRLHEYSQHSTSLCGEAVLSAVTAAIAVNEVNVAMGTICATPTAGSAGVVPGVLFAARDKLSLSREAMVDFLFTAGAFGMVIANRASISGAEGGCQAEVGSAAAMAAAALTITAGGTPKQGAEALAMTLKNTMGLVCDPVAGLVEVPCVKRNALGAALAFVCADLALAGVTSAIPVDEVIDTMGRVGTQMPSIFKETATGGLAASPTGERLAKEMFG